MMPRRETVADYADYQPHPGVMCVFTVDSRCDICAIHIEECRACGCNRSICMDLPCSGDWK